MIKNNLKIMGKSKVNYKKMFSAIFAGIIFICLGALANLVWEIKAVYGFLVVGVIIVHLVKTVNNLGRNWKKD